MLRWLGLNGRQENAAWFILFAVFDIGTFILATWDTPFLQAYETNILYRAYGMLPTLLFYVAFHAGMLYYLFKPIFRGREINHIFSTIFFLVAFMHLLGGISNINTWSHADAGIITAEDTPPTTEDTMPTMIAFMFIMWLMVMGASYSFAVYNSMADEQPAGKFPTISIKDELWTATKRLFKKKRGL